MLSIKRALGIPFLVVVAACSNSGSGDRGGNTSAIGDTGTGGVTASEPTATTSASAGAAPTSTTEPATDAAAPQYVDVIVIPPDCPFQRPDGICGWPTPDDQDGDGYPASVDCNDQVPTVNPGVKEVPCNNLDDDCYGIDNCTDLDHDGFDETLDCNDWDYNINPSAVEIRCNGLDEDCDGADTCDADGDGLTGKYPLPVSYAPTISFFYPDCDDSDASVYEGAPEVLCDGKDQDCDGTDCCDNDEDGDGTACKLDCDDRDPMAYPGAPIPSNFCGNRDLNCDGTKDGSCRTR